VTPGDLESVMDWRETARSAAGPVERGLERAIALAYGAAYDTVVRGFAPYQALLDDVVDLLARAGEGRPLRVLDVACGTGTVVRRLARAGHTVTGIDPVAHLVERAQRSRPEGAQFAHADLAAGTGFADESFDACVSLHTLNWHPRPLALLAECKRVLKRDGHAIILTYTRPASVAATFSAIRGTEGLAAASGALRWLVPTAIFEACRHYEPRYPDAEALHREISAAGFEVIESRPAFLAGISRLLWARPAHSVIARRSV
jgi:ubiquinone/menaquinone biosynthesis C-methylase UbiE